MLLTTLKNVVFKMYFCWNRYDKPSVTYYLYFAAFSLKETTLESLFSSEVTLKDWQEPLFLSKETFLLQNLRLAEVDNTAGSIGHERDS